MRWGLGDAVLGGIHAAVVDGTSHGPAGASVFTVAVVSGCCSTVAGVVVEMAVVGAVA